MEKNNKTQGVCSAGEGILPGTCAPLAYPYIPVQENNPPRYSKTDALQTGTLFPGLDLPFKDEISGKMNRKNTALAELMALDFAIDELGLYLTTHSEDTEVLDLYWAYIDLANEGRKKYVARYGPLFQTDVTEDGYTWLNDPWPWDEGGEA